MQGSPIERHILAVAFRIRPAAPAIAQFSDRTPREAAAAAAMSSALDNTDRHSQE
jgi:hypothetical protein